MRFENSLTRGFLAACGPVRELRRLQDEGGFREGAPLLSRPALLSGTETAELSAVAQELLVLLQELPNRLYDGDLTAYLRAVGAEDVVLDALAAETGVPTELMGRADLYRQPDGTWQVLECNVGHRIGGWTVDEIVRRALREPEVAGFAAEHALGYPGTRARMVAAIRTSAGRTDPVVAVLGAPASMRPGEDCFPSVVRGLRAAGLDAVGGHLGQLTRTRTGRLAVGTRGVDVVFRMFGLPEVASDPAVLPALRDVGAAARAGKVSVLSGIHSELAMSKANLALLSDPLLHDRFTAGQRRLAERVIPWTRVLRPGMTTAADGSRVDLLPDVHRRRVDLVLKPAAGFGGRGVVAGWTRPQQAWDRLVDDAVGHGYVVQQRVRPATERFRSFDGAAEEDVVLNWGPFSIGGGYAGCLVRGLTADAGAVVNNDFGARFTGVLSGPSEPSPGARRSH
ncbi:hypothetical protein [Cellulomonas sp. C5510]|uniref:hypothetical protein n=1 Tax=Cellulomonas sp. C5510 TaxID=2871170 RepID=UPI001C938AE5|nr:hypothetical protein [Cellulomonas sp. C5510]QZN84523.1 hypothetical protein K5O09_11745 [Cellulomonas sp. C5510]